MSHENAKILYQATQSAEQKFEYFLTGAIGAIFAYSVQNYTPTRIDLSPSILEPIAIVCLAGAFFCGLKRIECLFHHLGISYQKNQELGDAQVTEDALRLIVLEPHKHQPRRGSSIELIVEEAASHRSRAQSAEPLLDSLNTKVRLFYKWRNYLMFAGFFLVFLARVLSPYSSMLKQSPQQSDSRTTPAPQSRPNSNPPSAKE